jgi:DNA-binding beta-propeller fold protein YncE
MGCFVAPNAVTVDNDGTIYVVDTGNSRVQVFDKEGKFIRIINGSKDGTGGSTFVNPRGIGIDQRGMIYVVSNLTHIIYGFSKDGDQMFQFGSMGEANGQFYLPNGLFIDKQDNIYITDTLNLRVSVFN